MIKISLWIERVILMVHLVIYEKKETSLQLPGIIKIRNRQYKFRKVVSKVSSFVGNPVYKEQTV